MKDNSQSVLNSEVEHCRNISEEYYDKLLNSGYSDAAAVDACAHLLKSRSDLTGSTNQFNQLLRIILRGVSIVGIGGTVVSFNLPNKLSKVISEHNLELSIIPSAPFAASFP